MPNLPASAEWIKNFLEFYDFGPAASGNDPSGQACTFNFAPTTTDAVLTTLDAQATLAGYQLDRSVGQTTIKQMYTARAGAQKKGNDVVQKFQAGGKWDEIIDLLRPLDMRALLDVLETVRVAGQLDQVAEHLPAPRMQAAILSVQHHLGARWAGAMAALSDAEQELIRGHIYLRTIAGDLGDVKPLKNWQGATFASPPVDEATWVSGFLHFFGFGPDPLGNGSNDRCLFNARTQPLTDILDTVVEQGALAGYFIDRDKARLTAAPLLFVTAPAVSPSSTRVALYLSYAFIPQTKHVDLSTGASTRDLPAQQLGGQVTLEVHPENKSGLELSWVAQITAFDDSDTRKFKVQSILSGVQAAWVFSFLDGALQVTTLAQGLAGASRAQQTKDGCHQDGSDRPGWNRRADYVRHSRHQSAPKHWRPRARSPRPTRAAQTRRAIPMSSSFFNGSSKLVRVKLTPH
jgi:hypothetical protein